MLNLMKGSSSRICHIIYHNIKYERPRVSHHAVLITAIRTEENVFHDTCIGKCKTL